ncbi:MAG: hypothetical protein IK123_08130 [Lachnospiraceae bacterium]|nr:hypothetical protein [Lachnospiraceae bacterium]
MALGIVEINSAMTGINDFNNIRHNEEAKAGIDQTNFQNQFDQEMETKRIDVNESEDANNRQKKFDSRDKGSNEYSGDGGRNRKKKDENPDGRVIPKYSGFDMKI